MANDHSVWFILGKHQALNGIDDLLRHELVRLSIVVGSCALSVETFASYTGIPFFSYTIINLSDSGNGAY